MCRQPSLFAMHKHCILPTLQRFYGDDDDPDFVLSKADTKKIEAAQAEELQDLDPVPTAVPAGRLEDQQLPDKQQAAPASALTYKVDQHMTDIAKEPDPMPGLRPEGSTASVPDRKCSTGEDDDPAAAKPGRSSVAAPAASTKQAVSRHGKPASAAPSNGSSAEQRDPAWPKAGLLDTASSPVPFPVRGIFAEYRLGLSVKLPCTMLTMQASVL